MIGYIYRMALTPETIMTQPNPFILGARVVNISTHYRRRIGIKGTIVRVTPAGKFQIKWDHSNEPTDRLYVPTCRWNDSWTAEKHGGPKYSSEHVEAYDQSIMDEELENDRRQEAQNYAVVATERLKVLDLTNPENRALVKTVMDMLPLTYGEKKLLEEKVASE